MKMLLSNPVIKLYRLNESPPNNDTFREFQESFKVTMNF